MRWDSRIDRLERLERQAPKNDPEEGRQELQTILHFERKAVEALEQLASSRWVTADEAEELAVRIEQKRKRIAELDGGS